MRLLTTLLQAAIQGLTEFLPVSSSGHLVLAQQLLRLDQPHLTVSVALHAGTFLAVLVHFRRRIVHLLSGWLRRPLDPSSPESDTVWKIAAASAPTTAAGLLIKLRFASVFESVPFVLVGLSLTALALLATDLLPSRHGSDRPSLPGALLIGLAQGLAVLPGFSRSGWTVAAGVRAGLSRPAAAEFSFLAGLPALAGALLLETREMALQPDLIPLLGLGAAVAFLLALLSIRLLMWAVNRSRLRWFSLYLALLVATVLILTSGRP